MSLLNRETQVKVPEVVLLFWIAKLCTTCFGEAFSDYVFFNDYLGRTAAILMGLALILICYTIQIAATKYIPLIYWLAVTAVAIFGTMSADFLNKNLGMSLWESTVLLLVLQAAVFYAWWKTEGTLDVHSITTTRREIFYWLTVYLTFSLGTAAGDFVSGTLGFGTLDSTLIFLGIILVPLIGWKYLHLNSVLAFWLAYTLRARSAPHSATGWRCPRRTVTGSRSAPGRSACTRGSCCWRSSGWSPTCTGARRRGRPNWHRSPSADHGRRPLPPGLRGSGRPALRC